MYIRAYTGFGDPQPAPARTDWRRRMIPDPPPQPSLVFRRIGPFAVDKSALTPQLKQQVEQVVDFVRSRLNTAQAIGVIRIIGHTDASGTELHNIGLGNRRMESVRAELHAQLGNLIRRVLVDVEESPGKAKPIGDNRTPKGRAANRRVDVYVGPPIPKAESWTQDYDWTPPNPPPGPPTDPWCFDCPTDKLGGKSIRQFLMDVCRRRFSRDTCKTIVDNALSAGCKGVAALVERLGATVSDADKKEIQRQCKAAADKSL
jgi:outer membrane protein OmpA-like peptidoglycan-associated protein